jgi:hypothetical protein
MEHSIVGEDWSVLPVSGITSMLRESMPDVTFARYATFTTQVTFGERERTYASLFLFGTTPSGQLSIWPLDQIVGVSELKLVIDGSIFPETLLFSPRNRTSKLALDFIGSAEATPIECATAEPYTGFCWEPISGRFRLKSPQPGK